MTKPAEPSFYNLAKVTSQASYVWNVISAPWIRGIGNPKAWLVSICSAEHRCSVVDFLCTYSFSNCYSIFGNTYMHVDSNYGNSGDLFLKAGNHVRQLGEYLILVASKITPVRQGASTR